MWLVIALNQTYNPTTALNPSFVMQAVSGYAQGKAVMEQLKAWGCRHARCSTLTAKNESG